MVAGGGAGGQGALVEVIICARSCDGASLGGVCGGADGVAVEPEVCDVLGGPGDLELERGLVAGHGAVEGPAEEVVAVERRGDEGAFVEVVVGAGSCDGASLGGVGGGADGVAVDLEVGDVLGGSGDLELERGLSADDAYTNAQILCGASSVAAPSIMALN